MDAAQAQNAKKNAEPEEARTEGSAMKQRVPLSCTKAFDSLYFCYSPVHQAKQYYMFGKLDDCRGRLKRFRMCAMSRFRSQEDSEILYEIEEKHEESEKPAPVWEYRSEFLENVAKEEQKDRERVERGEKENTTAWWL